MPRLDIEPDLVRAFVAVAESGSFTTAAGVIGRSQSAVSQKIQRLEDILDMRVFERTSRSLQLTRDGDRLLAAARRFLVSYDAFLQELREPPRTALLRLGISENLVHTQLPRMLSNFAARYPDVQLELTTAASRQLLAEYEAGQLDVLIAKATHEERAGRGRVIWREPLVWLAASDYRPVAHRPVRLVMMKPPCMYREVMTTALGEARREWVTACTASNLVGIQAAVLGGLGVTVLGKSFRQDGMRILPASAAWPALPVAEVSVIAEDPAVQGLVEPLVGMLTEALADSPDFTVTVSAERE